MFDFKEPFYKYLCLTIKSQHFVRIFCDLIQIAIVKYDDKKLPFY